MPHVLRASSYHLSHAVLQTKMHFIYLIMLVFLTQVITTFGIYAADSTWSDDGWRAELAQASLAIEKQVIVRLATIKDAKQAEELRLDLVESQISRLAVLSAFLAVTPDESEKKLLRKRANNIRFFLLQNAKDAIPLTISRIKNKKIEIEKSGGAVAASLAQLTEAQLKEAANLIETPLLNSSSDK